MFFGDLIALIYGYTYIVVSFAIIGTSFHVASKVKLLQEFYDLIDDIHNKLGNISIIATAFEKKLTNQLDNKNTAKYDFIDNACAKQFINNVFDDIINSIRNHQKRIIDKMESIDKQLQKNSLKKLDMNSTSPESKEPMILSSSLNQTTIINNNYRSSENEKIMIGINTLQINTTDQNTEERKQQTPEVTTEKTQKYANEANDDRSEIIIINQDKDLVTGPSDSNEKLQQLNNYVNTQLLKYQIMCKKGFESYFVTLLEIRKLIFMVVSHFLDISSDIAVAYEWYILYQSESIAGDDDDDYNIKNANVVDMATLFWCCIGVILYYRIASAYKVYMFSKSKLDAFLQLIFDFYLIKLIYVNIVKMHSYKPLKIVGLFRGIEGSHESAYQAILTMVFLIQTNFTSVSSIIPLISLLFSLWSLASRFINLDKSFLDECASSSGISWGDIKHNGIFYALCNSLNGWYVYHIIFRTCEVIFSILMFSLFWTQLGSFVFGITMLCLAVVVAGGNMCVLLSVERPFKSISVYTDFLKSFFTVSLVATNSLFYIKYYHGGLVCIGCCLGTWLFSMRLIVTCLISAFAVVIDDSDINYNYNGTVSTLVVFLFCFQFALIILSLIASKAYLKENSEELMDGLDIIFCIENDDLECLSFIKQLNINIFDEYLALPLFKLLCRSQSPVNIDFYCDWYQKCSNGDHTGKCTNTAILMTYFHRHITSNTMIACALNTEETSDTLCLLKIMFDGGIDLSTNTLEYGIQKETNILLIACQENRLDEVQWILSNNIIIDINHVDSNGQTALHCALNRILAGMTDDQVKSMIQICKVLIQHGIDTHIIDNYLQTAAQVFALQNVAFDEKCQNVLKRIELCQVFPVKQTNLIIYSS